MRKPLEAVVIGAGNRGRIYGDYALRHPQQLRVKAVAEPRDDRRNYMVTHHDIAPTQAYHSWEAVVAQGKIADVAINCTMDRDHMTSTMALLDAGYDVLLEKPMSPVLAETVQLVQAAEDRGRLLQICHVLRYAPFWQTLREVVRSGKLGRIISVTHRENLSYYHMAHSFVRGNWRAEATSGPMILAKCCHDFDVLYWVLGQRVAYLNSFGALTYFTPENAPDGAAERCVDCSLADSCKYHAPRLYGHDGSNSFLNALEITPTKAARLKALATSEYGRCVWRCDNDVVDHQTVNMVLEDGTTVVLTMQGQGYEEGRTMRYDGTQATLYGNAAHDHPEIRVHHHLSGEVEIVPIHDNPMAGGGHGGGDFALMHSFINAVNGRPDERITTARESLESHLLAFAAEEARHEKTVIYMPEYRARVEALARSTL